MKMIILDPLLEIVHIKVLTLVDIGKLHALKKQDQFITNTGYYWNQWSTEAGKIPKSQIFGNLTEPNLIVDENQGFRLFDNFFNFIAFL